MNNTKLNLGCGNEILPDFLNYDIVADHPEVSRLDLLNESDLQRLLCSVSDVNEVRMMHVISYMNFQQNLLVFKYIFRLLKKGGVLIIETPEYNRLLLLLLCGILFPRFKGFGIRGMYAFDEVEMYEQNFYRKTYVYSYTTRELVNLLQKAGFVDIRIKSPQTHGNRIWRDVRIEATK